MSFVFVLQQSWLTTAVVAALLYVAAASVYRVYFSPLAKFPGPKLAAATLWYEAYYDVVKRGQYAFRIKELHRMYGPIVRINPHELHIDDPDYYEELYSRTSPRDKYKYYTDQFGIPNSSFSTINHRLHRLRRQPLNPFFSKQSIQHLEPIISGMVEKLCSRIQDLKKSGQPVLIRPVYQCLTTDVVTLYALNECWNYPDRPAFSSEWCATVKATGDMGNFMKQAPWLYPILLALPDAVISTIFLGMLLLLNWRRIDKPSEINEDGLARTIFHSLLKSDIPPEEKNLDRLTQEGQLIVGAGADTTANVLTVTTFHLLNNPDIPLKLREELENATPDPYEPLKLATAEPLPYLSAVINEGLRLSYGLSTRLQRVAPSEELHYGQWTIPAGTPVGMTSVLMHHNETIFPNSYAFAPERWLDQANGGHALERYLVSSKGSRQCIGINLAKSELYLTLASVFCRYSLELFDTDRDRDVDLKHGNFLPQPSCGSKGGVAYPISASMGNVEEGTKGATTTDRLHGCFQQNNVSSWVLLDDAKEDMIVE
ncbi:Cytochrome P450 [Venustampulla echinocandica]|uniref:Cytochrome P450 n=1 Tax=Venustampulla echinocandica TaxID=2656787 RepID=A0A370U1D8_9HELO|nr:Cytochrome P450 [Venustampulla echinocandica]RDL41592.1 Cytochrome P450 [Venustampulla echinocandica]